MDWSVVCEFFAVDLVQPNTGMNNRGGSFGKSDGAIVALKSV